MLYVLAIIAPPLSLLLCGKLFQSVINAVFWIPGLICTMAGFGLPFVLLAVVHAFVVVNARAADKRQARLVKALRS